MITLTLLHPIQSIPVQSWTFEHELVIRIGRSTDNHVILYSAVVSRHHVELRCNDSQWEVVSLGANGTYVEGKRITQIPLVDSLVIRLARSGPNIQIHFGSLPADVVKASQADPTAKSNQPSSQPLRPRLSGIPTADSGDPTQSGDAPPPKLTAPVTKPADEQEGSMPASGELTQRSTAMDVENETAVPPVNGATCTHPRAQGNVLFCPDCGQPLQVIQTIGDYQVVKTVRQDTIGLTQLVWRNGQSLVLRTLKPEWQQPELLEAFTQQAKQLLTLEHPGLPHFIDFFALDGKPHLVRRRMYGQSLQQRVMQHGPLAPAEAIAAIVQVCDTLEYLHQQSPSLIHEDLKPENLIQQPPTATGNITIVGFVSLTSFAATQQTATTAYLAPEQIQGQRTIVADLFALGPILVYLLTGQAPNAFYAQREQGFRFYPEYVPGLATEVVPIVRRLTNPQPEERYATAKEVAEALLSISTTA
ncbi:MAG: FHA domain-containing protein [Lyngbya sp. HA4199-MV5]|nr:FHA domain-containing protein [Lyngbya sp. HA4199-MV5]